VARTILERWLGSWKDDTGERGTPADAGLRCHTWQADTEAAKLAPLCRQMQHLDADHFTRLSTFLRDPTWEPTNNAAQRSGRAFRDGQHTHTSGSARRRQSMSI
jgi:hypothetical protein